MWLGSDGLPADGATPAGSMRLSTIAQGGRDGTLAVVSGDGRRALLAPAGIATLQAALDDWDAVVPRLQAAERQLEAGEAGESLAGLPLAAPLPRAFQWADASTYLSHMERIRLSRGIPLPPRHGEEPVVYQSGSDQLLPFDAEIAATDEDLGLDLEATVAVITGDVAQGASREEALAAVRLLVLTNDYTYRHVLPKEYAKGVGFYQCKPARPFAPFAVTPATLGPAWRDGLLHATVTSTVNDTWLGSLDSGADCAFDFGAIIAYMARTRRLCAGSIVAAGTISSRDPSRGFACLAEKRAVEITEHGEAATPLLQSGDRVRVEATIDGRSIFGAIDNRIVTRVRDIPTPRRRQHEQR